MEETKDPVAATYIGKLGLENLTKRLLKIHHGSPRGVVGALSKTPEFKKARDESDEPRRLLSADIMDFVQAVQVSRSMAEADSAQLATAGDGQKAPAAPDSAMVAATRERFVKTLALGEDWWRLASRWLSITEQDVNDYLEARDAYMSKLGDDGPSPESFPPAPPIAQMDVTRKSVLASLEVVKALRNDPTVQNIVNAKSVTVQHGMSQDAFLKTIFAIGDHLGLPRSKMLEAYSLTVASSGGQDIVDVVPLPKEPAWRTEQARRATNVGETPEDAGGLEDGPAGAP